MQILESLLPEEAQPVLQYMVDNYVLGRVFNPRAPQHQQRRVPPLYPPQRWNVHSATLEELPRTTNAVEGWHSRFNKKIGKCHPNVFEFVDRMKEEEVHFSRLYDQERAGRRIAYIKKKYSMVDKRILLIVDTYEDSPREEFLSAIAKNLKLQ